MGRKDRLTQGEIYKIGEQHFVYLGMLDNRYEFIETHGNGYFCEGINPNEEYILLRMNKDFHVSSAAGKPIAINKRTEINKERIAVGSKKHNDLTSKMEEINILIIS